MLRMLVSSLVSLVFFVLLPVTPAWGQGTPTDEVCGEAAFFAATRYARCVAKEGKRFLKGEEREDTVEGYADCFRRLEKGLSRIPRHAANRSCPDISASEIRNRIDQFLIREATAAFGAPPVGNTLLGAAPPAPTTCAAPVGVTIVDAVDYSKVEEFTRPDQNGVQTRMITEAIGGGACTDGSDCSAMPNGSSIRVTMQEGHIEGQACFPDFCGGLVWSDTCGPRDFAVDARNGCSQEFTISFEPVPFGTPGQCDAENIRLKQNPILVPGGSWSESCNQLEFWQDTTGAGAELCALCSSPTQYGPSPRNFFSCRTCTSGSWSNRQGILYCDE